MSRLHQSYRPEREANERFEEREIAARKRQSEQDLKRHITWFNKTAESNHLNVEDFSDGLTVARWARFQVRDFPRPFIFQVLTSLGSKRRIKFVS